MTGRRSNQTELPPHVKSLQIRQFHSTEQAYQVVKVLGDLLGEFTGGSNIAIALRIFNTDFHAGSVLNFAHLPKR